MNRVCIIGRLTRDPEIRMTQDQKTIARLGIAVEAVLRITDLYEEEKA